jgi:SAM-dependent methyltransferase
MDHSAEWTDVKRRAKTAYGSIDEIWPGSDPWSQHTRAVIEEAVARSVPSSVSSVLNVGCGGNEYGIATRASLFVNLDISLLQCRNLRRGVVADVDAMPFPSDSFDVVLCVGAVLNYSEPYSAIPELFRVAKKGGLVLLDFETTYSAELLFSKHWGKRVSVIEREYAGRPDKTFLFSEHHVRSIVEPKMGRVTTTHHYHTLTALWLRIARFAALPIKVLAADEFVSRIPVVNKLSSNLFLGCEKI